MDADRLRLLLRQRAEALAPPAALIDRALARCARIGTRRSAGLSAVPADVSTTPLTVHAPPPAAQVATVHSLGAAPAMLGRAGDLAPGLIIAGYRIEGLLGKGGMGSVYRATQLSMNRQVAFKVLAARLAEDPVFVGRFRREARAAGRLHHPNLVTVHDSGEADGLVFFSMELVEGRSLKTVLKERGPLPPDEALRLGRQALEALAYAHGRGVIHRDIKPDNLMLTHEGQIKVADLGLSRIDEGDGASSDMFQTTAGSFMGTPHYMAPEQGRDAHSADQRSDLYSLGATLFHLICGKPPFSGTSAVAVLVAAQSEPLTWPDPPPPPAVREFIDLLMAKDPAARPADAQAAVGALDRALAPHAGMHRQPAPKRRWNRALLATAALVVAAALILVAIGVVREAGRTRAWNETLGNANRAATELRFAEALDLLQRARESLPPGSPRETACAQAIAAITADWNAWAAPQIDEVERRFREALGAGRYSDARAFLRQPPDGLRSPEAEHRLEQLLAIWEAAAARDAERRPESNARAQLDEMHRRRGEFWRRARIEPPGAMQLHEGGVADFTASGSGSLPLLGPMSFGTMTLRLAWRGEPSGDAQWRLAFSPESVLVVRRDGVELAGKPLPRNDDGSVTLRLKRRFGGFALLPAGRDGGQVQPLAVGVGEPALSWSLGDATLSATLGGSR